MRLIQRPESLARDCQTQVLLEAVYCDIGQVFFSKKKYEEKDTAGSEKTIHW
jgi:hypothetical protein